MESYEFIIKIISGSFGCSKTDHPGILPTINDLLNTVFVHAVHCALSCAEFDEFYALCFLIASDRCKYFLPDLYAFVIAGDRLEIVERIN